MRKQTKLKRRSCAMCKPHKMGWENRWGGREAQAQREYEQESRVALRTPISVTANSQ